VICDGVLDAAATAALRAVPRTPPDTFSLGPVRLALEAKWPMPVSIFLANAMLRIPDGIRPHLLQAIRTGIEKQAGPASIEAVTAALG
jgi:hypothetical protein